MDSPTNWSLPGTTAALREAAMKNADIRITERKTRKIGFVVYSLWPKAGGKLKSAVLGGTNPGLLNWNERTQSPITSRKRFPREN